MGDCNIFESGKLHLRVLTLDGEVASTHSLYKFILTADRYILSVYNGNSPATPSDNIHPDNFPQMMHLRTSSYR